MDERYAGWKSGFGADVLAGKVTLEQADERALADDRDAVRLSGFQHVIENVRDPVVSRHGDRGFHEFSDPANRRVFVSPNGVGRVRSRDDTDEAAVAIDDGSGTAP